MKDDVTVVTGAGGGLGSKLVKILAVAVAIVVLVDQNIHPIQKLVENLQQQGSQTTA